MLKIPRVGEITLNRRALMYFCRREQPRVHVTSHSAKTLDDPASFRYCPLLVQHRAEIDFGTLDDEWDTTLPHSEHLCGERNTSGPSDNFLVATAPIQVCGWSDVLWKSASRLAWRGGSGHNDVSCASSTSHWAPSVFLKIETADVLNS